MPMQSLTMTDDAWREDNRLELFQVDLTGNANMTNELRVTTPNTLNQYYGAQEDRAVVIGDVIYYVHEGVNTYDIGIDTNAGTYLYINNAGLIMEVNINGAGDNVIIINQSPQFCRR